MQKAVDKIAELSLHKKGCFLTKNILSHRTFQNFVYTLLSLF
jgi:hypothetical protein